MPARSGQPERAPALDQKPLAGTDHKAPDSDAGSLRRVGRFRSSAVRRRRRLKELEPVAERIVNVESDHPGESFIKVWREAGDVTRVRDGQGIANH
jgi:hypothetical protein